MIEPWLRQFHLTPIEDEFVLYVPEHFSILRLSSAIGQIADRLQKGQEVSCISDELEFDEEDVKTARDKIRGLVERPDESIPLEDEPLQPPTIYLNIANACNLRCVYCYADCGTYNSKAGLMDEYTAFTAIDRFFDQCSTIGTIVFFGGEPMLHESLIPKACDYTQAQAELRGVACPRFSIVTNGTLLNEENVAILAKYGVSVTVSLDGPEAVNDLLRPDAQGKGTFGKVVAGLELIRKAGLRLNMESTFTSKHIQEGLTPKDLLMFFRDRYEVRSITIAPVSSTPGDEIGIHHYYEKLIPLYREAARFSMETMTTDRPIILLQINEILRHVLSRRKKPQNQFCYTKLGQQLFTVSTQGKVFPCQMMTDRNEFEMGSVFDENLSGGEKFQTVQNTFVSMNKQKLDCKNCWAQHVCFMCIAGVEIETKRLAPIPQYRCDMLRGLVEEVLIQVSALQKDPPRLQKFVDNFLRK